MRNPLISVVIPTKDEEYYLGDLLESIKKQTYKKYEILVCDYKSKDKTRQIARKYGARVIKVQRPGIAAGRNAGIDAARGGIIAFIDADYILPARLFESAVKQFREDPKTVGIVAPQEINEDEIPDEELNRFKAISRVYMTILSKSPLLKYNPFGCVFCDAKAVRKTGKFDETIVVSEDIDFYKRLRKQGRFKIGRRVVKMSFRRFVKEGFTKPVIRYLGADFGLLIHRPYRGEFKEERPKRYQ